MPSYDDDDDVNKRALVERQVSGSVRRVDSVVQLTSCPVLGNAVTGQLADTPIRGLPTRGLVNSWTRQLVD